MSARLTRSKEDQYTDAGEYDEYLLPGETNGTTPLQRAVYDDDLQTVTRIVKERGRAALKETDRLKNTALHTACYFGKAEAAKYLFERGASTASRNFDDQTPIDLAMMTGHDALAKSLGDEVKGVKTLLWVRLSA
eukprot:INCI14587.1.p1 GENE.INCI14587.1~~INCI14587.1.p1  ORF type:complete len:135 (-),score=22.32 INCI14587.1:366-770(-)